MKKELKSIWTIIVPIIALSGFTIIGINKNHLEFVLTLNWTVLIGMVLFLMFLMIDNNDR